ARAAPSSRRSTPACAEATRSRNVHRARRLAMSERTVLQSMARRNVLSLGSQASVRDAACAMTRANCGSVLVIDGAGPMVGILTERDLMTRVLAKGLNPDATPVAQVM